MNVFLQNLRPEYKQDLLSTRENREFVRGIVQQLCQVYEVGGEEKRRTDTDLEIEINREGYRKPIPVARFEVSKDGARVSVNIWHYSLSNVLGEKIDWNRIVGKHRSLENYHDKALKEIAPIAEKQGLKISVLPDSACGDHFEITAELSKNDTDLNQKIKFLMNALQCNDVKFKLGAV